MLRNKMQPIIQFSVLAPDATHLVKCQFVYYSVSVTVLLMQTGKSGRVSRFLDWACSSAWDSFSGPRICQARDSVQFDAMTRDGLGGGAGATGKEKAVSALKEAGLLWGT